MNFINICIMGYLFIGYPEKKFLRKHRYHQALINQANETLFPVAGCGDPYMAGQMPSSAMQEMYVRSAPGPMSSLGMGPRSQYPYGPGYDRR